MLTTLLLVTATVTPVWSYFQFMDEIRTNFEQSFHNRCDKYPFVDQWVKKLEVTSNRIDKFWTSSSLTIPTPHIHII